LLDPVAPGSLCRPADFREAARPDGPRGGRAAMPEGGRCATRRF
jgi:hypothetical protein